MSHHLNETRKFIGLYHRKSTRYGQSDRTFLTAIDTLWKDVQPHYQAKELPDKAMWYLIQFFRRATDFYFKDDIVNRAVSLQAVAAVPGMMIGLHHHLRSLRKMDHDHWIKIGMDDTENKRMHLLSLMEIYKPTSTRRKLVMVSQLTFAFFYVLLYAISPRMGLRFRGYFSEESVITYTKLIKKIDKGEIENKPAPSVAKEYWGLPDDATFKDMMLVIRADEADHRLAAHVLADVSAKKESDYFNNIKIHNPWQEEYFQELRELKEANAKLHPEEEQPTKAGKGEASQRSAKDSEI